MPIPAINLPPITVEVIADRENLRLSDTAIITLTIQGPAPLNLELPEIWLSETANAHWSIRPIADGRIQSQIDGRDLWSIQFRVSPYQVGEKVELNWNSIVVRSGRDSQKLEIPSKSFSVVTDVTSTRESEIRPFARFDESSNGPVAGAMHWPLGIAACVLLSVIFLALVFRNRFRPALSTAEAPLTWESIRTIRDPQLYLDTVATFLRQHASDDSLISAVDQLRFRDGPVREAEINAIRTQMDTITSPSKTSSSASNLDQIERPNSPR
jgi:hypothetical protein